MARRIKEVEGSVTEEVEGIKPTNLQNHLVAMIEGNFSNHTPLDITVKRTRIRVLWPPGPGSGADARPDNKLCVVRERGHIPNMVEVVVRPDHGIDVRAADIQPAMV
ncbi:hypothetical protein DV738_g244, partial [Chaetothyriales sp. CBS 135597]